MTDLDLAGWLAELRYQQRHRSDEITELQLRASWDRWLDAYNDARAEERSMTTEDHPAGELLIGHMTLATGELVTISTTEDQVVLALYALLDEETAGDDTLVQPAPVMKLDANECETLGSLLTYAAVSVYGQRPRLRPVNYEDDEQ
jgi:hypothetical protein